METDKVKRAILPWAVGGLLLGLVQTGAVLVHKPLGVSTQFVVAEGVALEAISPAAATGHPLLSNEKYRRFGYGAWLDLGLIAGALLAGLATRTWRLQKTTVWWTTNHGAAVGPRLAAAFLGGALILLGARIAGGCTSGILASGWAQLAVAAVPFTVTLFGAAMLTARLVYPRAPNIEP